MAKLEDLVVELKGDVSNLKASVNQAKGEINKFSNTAEKDLRNVDKSTKQLGIGFKQLGGIIGTYFGVRTLASIRDASMQMDAINNRMNAAVGAGDNAANSIKFVREQSDRLGLSFKEASSAFAGFAASATRSGLTLEQTQGIFKGVAEAATAMKLSVADQSLVFRALEQMAAKGVVSMEELRGQLGERLPGAVQIFAKSLGVSNAEFLQMVQNGQVGVQELVKFGDALSQEFGQSAVDASKMAVAATNRFGNALFDLSVKVGQNTGAMGAYSDALTGLAKFMKSDLVDDAIAILQTAILGLRATFSVVTTAIASMFLTMVNQIKQAINIAIESFNYLKQLSNEYLKTDFANTPLLNAIDNTAILGSATDQVTQSVKELQKEYAKLGGTSKTGKTSSSSPAQKESNPAVSTLGKSIPDAARKSSDAVKNATDDMTHGFSDLLKMQMQTIRSFDDLKNAGMNALQSILSTALQTGLFGDKKSGSTGLLGGLFGGFFNSTIGSLFGGSGRATGGSVSPNVPYMVGERGPEMFVPNVGGTVMNKNQMANSGGGSSVNVIQNISIGASVTAAVRQEIARMMPDLRRAAIAGVEDARLRGASI